MSVERRIQPPMMHVVPSEGQGEIPLDEVRQDLASVERGNTHASPAETMVHIPPTQESQEYTSQDPLSPIDIRAARKARIQQRRLQRGHHQSQDIPPNNDSSSKRNAVEKYVAPLTDSSGVPYTPFERKFLEHLANNRQYFFNIVFRMIGDTSVAEHIVQECI